ncbi:MAG: hypothetical protein AAFP86_23790 [Planctomycetota bacterium]
MLLWFFLAPVVALIDGELATRLPFRIDLGAAQCLVFALWIRPSLLPGLIVCTALARALWTDGDLALHVLAVGLPIAVALPVRTMMDRHSFLVQGGCALFLSVSTPWLTRFLAAQVGQNAAPLPVDAFDAIAALIFVPVVARGLAAVPPLVQGREDREEREVYA